MQKEKISDDKNTKYTHVITGVRTPTGFKFFTDCIGKRAELDGNAYCGFKFIIEGRNVWHRIDTLHFTYKKLGE